MADSIFLAKLLGLLLTILYGSVFIRFDEYRQIWKSLSGQNLVIVISGFIALLLGLLLVLTHNIWTFDYRGIITLLGWITLIGGIIRLLFPSEAIKMGLKMIEHETFLKVELALLFLIGLYLTYVGFTQ